MPVTTRSQSKNNQLTAKFKSGSVKPKLKTQTQSFIMTRNQSKKLSENQILKLNQHDIQEQADCDWFKSSCKIKMDKIIKQKQEKALLINCNKKYKQKHYEIILYTTELMEFMGVQYSSLIKITKKDGSWIRLGNMICKKADDFYEDINNFSDMLKPKTANEHKIIAVFIKTIKRVKNIVLEKLQTIENI
jgi:hypothetical protein